MDIDQGRIVNAGAVVSLNRFLQHHDDDDDDDES